MQDRAGTNNLANGAVRYGVYDSSGNLLRYQWVLLADDPLATETPLLKSTMLKDETAASIWVAGDAPADPKVNDALNKLAEPNYKVGDILVTVRELSTPWHACDGSTFDQATYPDLYAVLGGTTLPTVSYSDDTTTYIKMLKY